MNTKKAKKSKSLSRSKKLEAQKPLSSIGEITATKHQGAATP